MNTTGFTDETLPVTDALKRVITLSRGRRCYVAAGQLAPIKQMEEGEPQRFFSVMSHVECSHKTAVAFISSAYAHFAERGAMVRISYSERCLFIGQPA